MKSTSNEFDEILAFRNAMRGRFFGLLVAMVLLIAVYPYVSTGFAGKVILNCINVLILVLATLAVEQRHSRLHLVIAALLAGVTLVSQIVFLATDNVTAMRAAAAGALVFYAFTVVNILRHVLRGKEVTADKIHGAICAYLLFAVMWAAAYVLVESFVPGSIDFGPTHKLGVHPNFYELLYFSIVTLTTTGYGDIVPVSAHARSLANLEQLTGIFYVAILIARLAGLYPARRSSDESNEFNSTLTRKEA